MLDSDDLDRHLGKNTFENRFRGGVVVGFYGVVRNHNSRTISLAMNMPYGEFIATYTL